MINKLRNKFNNGDVHFKEILTGSAITFVLKMLGILLGYIVILIISRNYGAESVGIYNLTLSIMMFLMMISAMGTNISILRYVGQFNNKDEEYKLKLLYKYVLELVLPLSIVLAALLYIFSDVIAEKALNNSEYKPALQFIAFIIPFTVLQEVSVEFIRGLKQLKVSEFLRSVNRPVVNIILLLSVGVFVVDQLLPLYAVGVGIILSALFAFYFIMKKIKKIEFRKSSDFTKKELLQTSFPMMVTGVLSFVMGNISLFMLEIFSTTKDVGIFSVALKIATLISLILVVVNTISAPKFSELYWEKKYDELQIIITQSTKIIFFISMFISIFLIVLSKLILGIFGNDFIAGSFLLVLLILGEMINSVTGSVSILLNMTGNQKILRNIIIFSMLLTVLISYVTITNYGLDGAGYAFIVSMILVNVTAAIYVKIKLGYVTYYNPFMQGV